MIVVRRGEARRDKNGFPMIRGSHHSLIVHCKFNAGPRWVPVLSEEAMLWFLDGDDDDRQGRNGVYPSISRLTTPLFFVVVLYEQIIVML
jgi:hypothetical protein